MATTMAFEPIFRITPETAKALMAIEASRTAADRIPMHPKLMASLRESARLHSTHYSTRIEGNRLTLPEVKRVILGKGGFPGRERDEREVQSYYKASGTAEAIAGLKRPLDVDDIRLFHGTAFEGVAKPTPYRDGQNVIRDGVTGGIVYMPPEAKEVPGLMKELVEWINDAIAAERLPAPLIAALAHYQFATIHPYYDGNGRTARLLATMILHRCGYGLKGIFTLEEFYARNLVGYYKALAVGPSHNYHLGRAEADVSGFVQYFCVGMADAFARIVANAGRMGGETLPDKANLMRALRPLQRQVLGLLAQSQVVTANEIAAYLGIPSRQARESCAKWVGEGFFEIENSSRKARSYRLADRFETGLF